MIRKERLQELIDEGATVYFISDNIVHEIDLGNPPQEVDFYGDLVQTEYEVGEDLEQNFIGLKDNFYAWELEYLYEHKADAEWDLEFGNIERTERLNLPRWEELKPEKFVKENADKEFVTQGIVEFEAIKDIHTLALCVNENNEFNIELSSDTGEFYQSFEFSKDGYEKACRLIKKLFMGEE